MMIQHVVGLEHIESNDVPSQILKLGGHNNILKKFAVGDVYLGEDGLI